MYDFFILLNRGGEMLKRKALRKILITTFATFTLLVLYLIPTKISNPNLANFKEEVIYTSDTVNQQIYLLGENNYLVKFSCFLESLEEVDKIREIIDYLKLDSSKKIPTGLSGVIPKDVRVLDINVDDGIAIMNFSKELLNIEEKLEERMIESIIYSVTELDDIDGVTIKIDGVTLEYLPKTKKKLEPILTREFGINKVYDITNRNGIQKVTVYYLDKISNNNYYVPVTKYLNDDRDKIKIIIDNLASSYIHEANLMSYLNSKTTVLGYEEKDKSFILDLNDEVFKGDSILEEVEYTLSHSIFDSYNVEKVMFKVNGELIKEIEK